jgi:xanthine dehydrogenase accessory factor
VRAEILKLAAELAGRGEPFVLAMVVRRESYSSAQQGDMAVITADGGYHGWLGGNCTQPTVKREARRALADGRPRLVSLTPEPERELRPGVRALPMTCHSGGTVDIYLEPVMPAPRLLLFGASPVVRALAQLGKAMGYAVDVVAPGHDGVPGADRHFPAPDDAALRAALATFGGRTYAVVATMGDSDEDCVTAALAARPAYLGVVASRKRFAEVRQSLVERGLSGADLDRIHNPAGLDIGARVPEEVALSILAEVVQERRAAVVDAADDRPAEASGPAAADEREEIDPVCHMTVTVATARHTAVVDGRTWYFCNPRCREKFIAAPDRYREPPPSPATSRVG